MSFLRCPKQESLLELVSIPAEMPMLRRTAMKLHVRSCAKCATVSEQLRKSFEAFFKPEVDVTSSLLRVYGRLQNDETLILKGWKLNESRPQRDAKYWLFQRGYLFRGGLAFGAVALITSILVTQFSGGSVPQETTAAVRAEVPPPFAQIRIEDRNSVKVHYVQPELLQSTEFETTSAR